MIRGYYCLFFGNPAHRIAGFLKYFPEKCCGNFLIKLYFTLSQDFTIKKRKRKDIEKNYCVEQTQSSR